MADGIRKRVDALKKELADANEKAEKALEEKKEALAEVEKVRAT